MNGTFVVRVQAFDGDLDDGLGFNEVRYYMDDDRFDVNETTVSAFIKSFP